ncbi:UDP-N-acetylmuramoyl-L-alanyl-D-glutamate--2,6-diaminopimelate ligase [Thiolapillus sp.]
MAGAQQQHSGWLAGDLLGSLGLPDGAWQQAPVAGLSMDSRNIGQDDLFLAVAGSQVHGLEHLQQALDQGASLVLTEASSAWPLERICRLKHSVPIVVMDSLRPAVSEIAARFYAYPAENMRMAGVTGTNGKTSVSLFLAQALPEEWRCAVTGTTGNGFPGDLQPATHTTPDAVEAQRLLAGLKAAGAKAVAMEVSSHALHQYRLAAVPFHTAVFTNLSRDHLDYHGSIRAYAAAKRRLFQADSLQLAVINTADETGAELLPQLQGNVATIACHRGGATLGADEFVCIETLEQRPEGLHLAFSSSWGKGEINSRLLGDFNADNLALVLAVLLGWGVPMEQAIARLETLETVPGRMQKSGGGEQPLVVVDYAHTPDALAKTLTSLRAHGNGRIYCVFGCGGDRDRGKRSQMGTLAEALADVVIVTDDNPRNESSAAIIADILEGMEKPHDALVIPDRAEAIATAIGQARPGDIVLIAGKGHETWQQIGDQRLPFSDMEQVRHVLGGDA